MSTVIKQKVKLPLSPKQAWEFFTTSRLHTKVTKAPAFCGKKEGAAFSAYNGSIHGFNVEMVANKRVVQAWRAKDWPKGVWSMVSFQISKDGRNGCVIEFTHTGVPKNMASKLKEGWKEHYWQPLKEFGKLMKKSSSSSKPSAKGKAKKAA